MASTAGQENRVTAINRPVPGAAFEREDVYQLRRVLVKRLQEATRGVSRRDRVAAWKRFAEEWREMALRGTLASTAASLDTGEANAESGLLAQLARGQGLASVVRRGAVGDSQTIPAARPARATLSEVDAVSPAESQPMGDARNTAGSRPGAGRKERQVELFAPALVVQPL